MTLPENLSTSNDHKSALRPQAQEMPASSEELRHEVQRLRTENFELTQRLSEAIKGIKTDRAIRRAALNLMEDALLARQAEERENIERRRVEAELREANRHKDEFLAVLAHELRNPLAPIANGLRLLRTTGNDGQKSEELQQMLERQVRHMIRLIDDLLDVSRFTTGRIELQLEPIELANIVRDAVEISKPLIDVRQHQLSVKLPEEPIVINGDPVRLAQMLANLLCNAAKYTIDQGHIELVGRREQEEAVISVRDSGEGIPAEKLPKVFDLFSRGDGSLAASQAGLGIGLALVRSLAMAHDGTVEAHSEGRGQGSEFVVRLPISSEPLDTDVPQPNDWSTNLDQLRILVVDDNRDAADSLVMLLKGLRATVWEAYDGPAALNEVTTRRPAVVLLDIGMPGMDGIEVARRIRAMPDGDQVKLCALTGWGQPDDVRKLKESGFDEHLLKPVDFNKLLSLLSSIHSAPVK